MSCWLRRCVDCTFPLGRKDVFCPRCGAKQRREKLNPAIIETQRVPFLFEAHGRS